MPLLSKPRHGDAIAKTESGEKVFAEWNLRDYLDELENVEDILVAVDISGLTAEEIRDLYESNPNRNAFTDALLAKLNGIESGAQVNPTVSEIKTASGFTDALEAKLNGIEAGAEVNPTASEIKTLYESNTDTNEFTDAEKAKLADLEADELLITRSDNVEDSPMAGEKTIYVGKADAGTADSSALWRIQQFIFNSEGDVYDGGFADGDTNFDNAWTDRLSKTYS
jgi:hypothetical protein